MKTAREWVIELCNKTILNVRGNEIEKFIKDVQNDATAELKEELQNLYYATNPDAEDPSDENPPSVMIDLARSDAKATLEKYDVK